MYTNVINNIEKNLSKVENFPNIIQGIGLALLTILIPLAIAILADAYQKRKNKDNEFVHLDLHVILDNVFNIRLIIFSVFLIFLPLFFWNIFIGLWKLIAIVLTFIGVLLLTVIIIKVYHWIKGNVFDYRFSYLKKANKENDLEVVWKSVWEAPKIDIQNEKEFCKIFFNKVHYLFGLSKNRLKILSKLLNNFYSYIEYRSLILLLEPNISFNRILEWHFKSWQNEYMHIKKYSKGEDKSNSAFNYREISRALDAILSNIEERSVKGQEFYAFIIYFKKHAEKYKYEVVDNGNKHYYIDHLFEQFYRTFFKSIEEANFSAKYILWDQCFPEDWKVTKNNLENNESRFFSNLSFKYFFNWAMDRINKAIDGKDLILGEVANNLFPGIDSNLFLTLLIIFTSGSNKKNNVKYIIEKPWDFGFHIKTKLFPGEINKEEMTKRINEDEKREEQETYELVFLLFKKIISKENIQQYIEEIECLKYSKDSNEELERNELLDIFKKMSSYLENK
ncbi:MAG: hypothetical protein PHQ76_04270 [Caldisericia bacterium]|nr:hypothetical protein [Caldisericia bacterium]MDD5689478.1 hypothetical protein [Caldisericia bacterium]